MALMRAIETIVLERRIFGRKCDHIILSNITHNLLVTEVEGIGNIIAQLREGGKTKQLESYQGMKVIVLDRDDMYFTVG